MIFDIKYYILTITAIFISLGIGIFIGVNMNGQDIFLEQQQQLVKSLEDRFNELRLDKDKLQHIVEDLKLENQKRDHFIEKAYYEIIDGKLLGYNIAIFQTTEHYYYNSIKEVLEEAGALVPIHVVFTDRLLYLSDEELNKINDFLDLALTKQETFEQINVDIINLIVNKAKTELIDFLLSNDLIKLIHYYETDDPIGHVVIAGGSHEENNQFDSIDLGLIKELQLHDIRTIGVERSDIHHSAIPLYKENGISTIDNIDTIFGRISLIYILEGRNGSFGEKPYSEELVPF